MFEWPVCPLCSKSVTDAQDSVVGLDDETYHADCLNDNPDIAEQVDPSWCPDCGSKSLCVYHAQIGQRKKTSMQIDSETLGNRGSFGER